MKIKTITPKQALELMQKLCSTCEKCTADIRQKLIEYKIEPVEVDKILQQLQTSGFIDDERFVCAFVRTKHKIAKWGKQKIEFSLRNKQIPQQIITKALTEIHGESNSATIEAELQKKLKTLKAKSKTELAAKLLRFALSRGYEYSESYEIAKGLIDEIADN